MNKAYTLVELAIVLSIIAIILGAVMTGISLVEQATIRAVITEAQNYQQAANSFKERYSSKPGDFSKAAIIWPECDTISINCNGNDNGLIDLDPSMVVNNSELVRFWQHLSLSSLVSQSFIPAFDNANQIIIGKATPNSKYKSLDQQGITGWSVNQNNNLILAGIAKACNSYSCQVIVQSDAISPADAYQIDQKIDDGFFSSGEVSAEPGINNQGLINPNCLDSTSVSGYKVTNTRGACLLKFNLF